MAQRKSDTFELTQWSLTIITDDMDNRIEIPSAVAEWLERIRQEAYQKGWDEATVALVQAAKSARPVDISSKERKIDRKPFRAANATGEESNKDKVIRALRNEPGMRFADIPRWLQKEDASINRLTIITTARRLLKNRVLRKRGVRLYVNDAPEQQEAAA